MSDIETEERAFYAILIVATLPVVIGVIAAGAYLDTGATISLGVVVLALAGLCAGIRRDKLPRATARFPR